MNTIGIRAYGAATGAEDNEEKAKQKTQSSLGQVDFLKLLAAQFQHQDINNPTSNTEFISQLAQFSSLQQMNIISQSVDRQYCASLVGKTVEVESKDSSGKSKYDIGIVDSAAFGTSGSSIIIDGKAYNSSNIVKIINKTTSDTDTGKTDDKDSKDPKDTAGV